MAIRLTPEQENDILMQRSVVDEPRSMLQKVLDFAWGRTLPEQMTSAFTGGTGGIFLKNPYQKLGAPLVPLEAVNRGVRSLGREAMEFLRSSKHDFSLRFAPKDVGEIVYPGTVYINPTVAVGDFGLQPRTVIEHELAHGLYRNLPDDIKRFVRSYKFHKKDFTPPLPGVSSPYGNPFGFTRLDQMRSYPGHQSGLSELFAVGSETPTSLPGQMLEPEAKASFDRLRRTVRGMLRSRQRARESLSLFEHDPGEGLVGSGIVGPDQPTWKLSENAPSWLQRAFEGGVRETPLQAATPKRVPLQGSGLVKNPVTYELPESADELGALMEQLGGSYGKFPVSGDAPDRTQLQRFMRRR